VVTMLMRLDSRLAIVPPAILLPPLKNNMERPQKNIHNPQINLI
jgi:hypothetical protein